MAVENVAGSEPSIRGERNAACRIQRIQRGERQPKDLITSALAGWSLKQSSDLSSPIWSQRLGSLIAVNRTFTFPI